MGGLLYKNFLLYRIELVILGVIQVIISFTMLMTGANARGSGTGLGDDLVIGCGMYFCMFFLTGFFESGLFAHDEKLTAGCFIMSTPQGAKGHVQSKYYSILIINLAVLMCCFLTDTLVIVLSDSMMNSLSLVLVIFFSINLVIEAISIPFLVRFGSNNGVSVKVCTLGVLLLLVSLYALFGDISFLLSGDFQETLTKFFSEGNILLIISLIPYVSLLLYYISCRISVMLYRKGAENYD